MTRFQPSRYGSIFPNVPWAPAPGDGNGTALDQSDQNGATAQTSCTGPLDAKLNVIYLHGIDPPTMTDQEKGNRVGWRRIAKSLNLRVALARSPDACGKEPDKRCWPNDSGASVAKALKRLVADVQPCFGGNAPDTPLAVVGFSNGGYFVGKLFQYCLMPKALGLIAVGSAGSWAPADPRIDLGACGHFRQMIGDADITHDKAQVFVEELLGRNGRAEFYEFTGAHELPIDDVGETLVGWLAAAPR